MCVYGVYGVSMYVYGVYAQPPVLTHGVCVWVGVGVRMWMDTNLCMYMVCHTHTAPQTVIRTSN